LLKYSLCPGKFFINYTCSFTFREIGVRFLQNITREIEPMFYVAAEAYLQYVLELHCQLILLL
jgi:hypothetical protein